MIKSGQKDHNRHLLRNTYRWPIGTWKNAQHYQSGKYKSIWYLICKFEINLQVNNEISIHAYQNGYHKKTTKKSVGKDVEKGIVLFTLGGNINWYSHDGKQYTDSSKIKNRNTIWSRSFTFRCLSNLNKNTN